MEVDEVEEAEEEVVVVPRGQKVESSWTSTEPKRKKQQKPAVGRSGVALVPTGQGVSPTANQRPPPRLSTVMAFFRAQALVPILTRAARCFFLPRPFLFLLKLTSSSTAMATRREAS